jgi:hypothetical protein
MLYIKLETIIFRKCFAKRKKKILQQSILEGKIADVFDFFSKTLFAFGNEKPFAVHVSFALYFPKPKTIPTLKLMLMN